MVFSILVAVVVVGAASGATPNTFDDPAVVVLEVDADGSTSERTSVMRREVGINKHQRTLDSGRDQQQTPAPTQLPKCDTNVALDTSGDAERMWAGDCKTLADCQAACKAWPNCTAFNWWPKKGGCRLVKGDVDEGITPRNTSWITISGIPDCELDVSANLSTIKPYDCGACVSNCASKQCSAHPECAKLSLAGDCCPNSAGLTLDCCEKVYTEAQMSAQCTNHKGCVAVGMTGACCPTTAGVLLECCDQNLDKDDD